MGMILGDHGTDYEEVDIYLMSHLRKVAKLAYKFTHLPVDIEVEEFKKVFRELRNEAKIVVKGYQIY